MNNQVKKVKVKGSDRIIEVYKLKELSPDGKKQWNIFLGDDISMIAVEQGKHNETFTEDQLEFI